jgi:hypothetical protein
MIVKAIQKSNKAKIKAIIIVHQIIKKIIVQTNDEMKTMIAKIKDN